MSKSARVVSTIDFTEVFDAISKGSEQGLRDATEYLLTEANKHVPHDEGTLERTGQASTDGTRGAVSYDTPYAVRQHEDMELNHDGKGQAKWLENTMGREKATVGQIIAGAVKSEVDP